MHMDEEGIYVFCGQKRSRLSFFPMEPTLLSATSNCNFYLINHNVNLSLMQSKTSTHKKKS